MTDDVLKRAGRYLVEKQNADGSWGIGDPFVCARALRALKAAGGPEASIDSGLKYLEGCQAPDGRFPAKADTYTDAACTAYALIVLHGFDYSKASLPVSKGIRWLLEHQNADGTWRGKNVSKNAYTTSLCLRALHVYYLSSIEKYRLGLERVLEKVTKPSFFDEPVSHVYAPVLNLCQMGQLPPSIRQMFIKYADWHLPGALYGSVADVAYLAGTLAALGEVELREICVGWLSAAQCDDGGFSKDLSMQSDPNWTALVVLALVNRL